MIEKYVQIEAPLERYYYVFPVTISTTTGWSRREVEVHLLNEKEVSVRLPSGEYYAYPHEPGEFNAEYSANLVKKTLESEAASRLALSFEKENKNPS